MDTPNRSNGYERVSSGARALLGLLQPVAGSAAAARMRDLPPQAWDEVLEIALRHGVAPLLHRALQSAGALTGLPHHVRARLADERRATALDNLRNYGQFRRIARALRDRGIPVIALKGLHLAELVYRDISLRPMSDLDILVPHSQVEDAVATLLKLEYEPKLEFDRDLLSRHDVAITHRRLGTLVEVHWTLAEPTEFYTPPIEDIWRLAVPVRLGDVDAHAMSPEFLLLHVCAHLAYHHLFAFDLRALCDIAEVVHACPVLDWAAVVDQGRRHGWGHGVAVALRLARDHLGAAVPADALAAIGGDALDPQLLDDALEQLCTSSGIPIKLRCAPNLQALKSPIGWRAKLAILWRRIFVSRSELGLIYGVPERAARINFYYAVRLRDLVRRYAASARELDLSAPLRAATAARHARLAKWINDA